LSEKQNSFSNFKNNTITSLYAGGTFVLENCIVFKLFFFNKKLALCFFKILSPMPITTIVVTETSQFDDVLKKTLAQAPMHVLVLFEGDDEENGESWCSDCRQGNQINLFNLIRFNSLLYLSC
jgi:hypothetical protein